MDKKKTIFNIINIIIGLATWGFIIFLVIFFTKEAYFGAGDIIDSLLGNSNTEYKEYTLVLDEDTNYHEVLEILESEEIILNTLVIEIDNFIQNVKRDTIPQGTYLLNNQMNPNEINNVLINKKEEVASIEKVVTIKEGLTINELGILLESQELVVAEEFIEVANTYNFKEEFSWLGEVSENYLEGYLYPDTYNFYNQTTPKNIIYKLLVRFEEVYSPYYGMEESIGMNLNEVITMASIIQKEVNDDSARSKLSSLIHNRLNQNENLKMKSTVQYVVNKREESFTAEDYKVSSPYNTFENTGLPPKPICSPSIASIDAVFNYNDEVYLYFEKLENDEYLFTNDYNEILEAKSNN